MSTAPLRVAITGAAGQIGYSLLFRIASGAMFGPNQSVILHLIEIEPALPALGGVVMELDDCAFPLLKGVVPTANLDEGFRGVNWALLVGSIPRKQGMERKDLLGINGKIFIGQGRAIQKNATPDVRILVVGNPCNTNCLIAMNNAPQIQSWTPPAPSSTLHPPATGTASPFAPMAATASRKVSSAPSPSAATAKNSKSSRASKSTTSAAVKSTPLLTNSKKNVRSSA